MIPVKRDLLDLHKHLSGDEESEFLYTEIGDLLNNIQTGSTRASSVINRLVEITPKQENHVEESISLDELVGQLLDDLKTGHPDIDFTVRIPVGLMIKGVFEEIHHLMNYVLRNAIDAVQGVKKPEIVLEVHTIVTVVVIKISDNGEGVSDKIINQIFEPFFSTKEPGDGIGLGLFISQTIVRKHSGTIKVESEEGKGATFTIELPQNIH